MIIIDTNVLSEVLRPEPDVRVSTWLARQPSRQMYTTAISRAEINFGILAMPDGSRKARLSEAAQAMFDVYFSGRLLPFDETAADEFASLSAGLKRVGRPMGIFDGMIASIVRSRGARLVTRNTKDFGECEIELIDPWNA